MSRRYTYYEELKELARECRRQYGIRSCRVLPSELRHVLKSAGVNHIDRRPLKKVRGLYVSDEYGCSVLVNSALPRDPYAFTLAHEFKHHLCDRNMSVCHCTDSNTREAIEIGAEVFAAELLFPEKSFVELMSSYGVGKNECTPEHLVRLKHDIDCTLSYSGLAKRAVFLGIGKAETFRNIRWRALEEAIYGKRWRA